MSNSGPLFFFFFSLILKATISGLKLFSSISSSLLMLLFSTLLLLPSLLQLIRLLFANKFFEDSFTNEFDSLFFSKLFSLF
jgi:hypothetical protein